MPNYQGLIYSYPIASQTPPLTTDMPYEVMLSYLLLDTISKSYYVEPTIENFIKNLDYQNDTLKIIIKYAMITDDYNPLLLQDMQRPRQGYKAWIQQIFSILANKSVWIDSAKFNISTVFESNYILHIKVLDHNLIMDSSASLHKEECQITFQIYDDIKGKLIPKNITTIISNNNFLETTIDSTIAVPADSGLITKFIFCTSWRRPTIEGIFVKTPEFEQPDKQDFTRNGEPWIKTGDEAIVFLSMRLLCSSQGKRYYILTPFFRYSHNGGIYIIKHGKVINDGNDFGLGDEVQVEVFKNHFKNIIQTINNW
jgi:hypothetical protein